MNIEQERIECASLKSQGYSRAEIASKTGLTKRQVKSRLSGTDPAIQKVMEQLGTGMTPSAVWLKGENHSTLLKPVAQSECQIEKIADAFNNIKAAKASTLPAQTDSDLLTVYPLFDVHFGMYAWGEEAGEDYNVDLAKKDMHTAISKVFARTPDSDTALIVVGGDYFHADDGNAETPASKNKLDVDGRHDLVIDLGVDLLAYVVDTTLTKHSKVIVKVMRGNHDENSHRCLRVGMQQRYRNEERVEVDTSRQDLYFIKWGDSLAAFHHGDKSKPERIALEIADTCKDWSDTYYRYIFTGDIHHNKVYDLGAIQWESMRAFCPRDAYAAGKHYSSRRQLQSLTFDKQDGLVARGNDPVRRSKK